MKRGSSLRRYTGLRSSKPLRSSTALRRTARIAGTPSKAQKRQQAARRAAYAIVDKRSGGRCEAGFGPMEFRGRCWEDAAEHHHRRGRRAGGSTDPLTETAANIVHLCAAHHRWVTEHPNSGYADGLLVRAGHDPKTVRVLLWCGWVLLDDDGGREAL